MKREYTKADLEELIYLQLENLNAVHDLIGIMKHQNELLEKANGNLKTEVLKFKKKLYRKHNRKGKEV